MNLKKKKINYNKLTNYFISEYSKSFKELNIIKPNYEPKVTNHINDIINTIKILINNNNAYINNNGDVVFNINSYDKYGLLSNRKKEYININNNNLDFVLWKKISNNEKFLWNSPWGKGRPGWHIECTSMIKKFFNNNIDIHGGGSDLLFPHHENELAQINCAYNNFKIKNWIHIGTVNFLSKKISKSDNKYINLNKILNLFNYETIRYILTKKHYRKPIEINIDLIKKANLDINNLYKSILNINFNLIKNKKNIKSEFTIEFLKNINDDFNIPKIYSLLFLMSNKINKLINYKYKIATDLINEMINLGSIIGILQENPINFLKNNKNKLTLNKIKNLIKIRNIARKNKNWIISDKLKNFLLKNKIYLEDYKNKTFWKIK